MKTRWYWRIAPPGVTLEKLFSPETTFCFLAGSGISLDPPSCLPTGYQFTKALLERLIPEEQRTNILALMNPDREGMRNPSDFLRFEQLMGYLHKDYDRELRVLDGYAQCKAPNFNHLFLAQMLTQGHAVLTTNFDSLIEYALLKARIPQKQIFPVIHRSDWEKHQKENHYPIYKLHGSLIDVRNDQECRDSLQATLAQIAQGKSMVFQLESWKLESLQTLFQNQDVVVFGYSGLDDFDVLPTLWNIPSSKRILWISYDGNRSLDKAQIDILESRTSSEIQKSSYNESRTARNLLKFAQNQKRNPDQIFHIIVHTGQLLESLWHRYTPNHLPPALVSTPCPEKNIQLPSHLSLSESQQWLLTARILDDRNHLSQAIDAYQTTLSLAQKEGALQCQKTCLLYMSKLLSTLGRRDEALKYSQQLLDIFDQTGEIRGKALALINRAFFYLRQRRFNEALNYYKQVLPIAEQTGDILAKAAALNNIGNIFVEIGIFDEARRNFQQALEMHEQTGDLREKASVLNSIGFSYRREMRFEEALKYYKRSLAINEQIGELYETAKLLNNIGIVYQSQGRLDKALENYQWALIIDDQLNEEGKVIDLRNIGDIHHHRGQYDEALNYFQQALQVAQRLENDESIAIIVKDIKEKVDTITSQKAETLAVTAARFCRSGQLDLALEYYQQALTIFKDRNDSKGKANVLHDIGGIFFIQNRLDEALDYFQQALQSVQRLEIQWMINDIQDKITIVEAQLAMTDVKQTSFEEYNKFKPQFLTTDKDRLTSVADWLFDKAALLAELGKQDQALRLFYQVLTLYDQLDHSKGKSLVMYNIGVCLHALNRYNEALRFFLEALKIAESIDYFDFIETIKMALETTRKKTS
ncbi:MAG: tetratricopeptide repeat protein [Promethearchaeota archaeon]